MSLWFNTIADSIISYSAQFGTYKMYGGMRVMNNKKKLKDITLIVNRRHP